MQGARCGCSSRALSPICWFSLVDWAVWELSALPPPAGPPLGFSMSWAKGMFGSVMKDARLSHRSHVSHQSWSFISLRNRHCSSSVSGLHSPLVFPILHLSFFPSGCLPCFRPTLSPTPDSGATVEHKVFSWLPQLCQVISQKEFHILYHF